MRDWIWKTMAHLLIWPVMFACAGAPTVRFSTTDIAGSTWVNKDYPVGREDMRISVTADGELQLFDSITAATPKLMKRIKITKFWKDAKGDLWFRDIAERRWLTSAEYNGPLIFELNRISNSFTVWETTSAQDDDPSEMGFTGGAYSIRYREE
jgi:hypothetical protein